MIQSICPICDAILEQNLSILHCKLLENSLVITHYNINPISNIERYRFYDGPTFYSLSNYHNTNKSSLSIAISIHASSTLDTIHHFNPIIPINKDTRNRLLNLKAFL